MVARSGDGRVVRVAQLRHRARRGGWLLACLLTVACTAPLPPQAIAPPPAPPPPAAEPHQLVVAVDDLGQGFNPHLMSDLSPVSAAVSTLVLPSVFRPGTDGALALDPTVASSARVTSSAPFTVTYELNLSASWSDNTPIAAEDFVYLWERMRREPGVVDSAGYRLITDVRSRAGGKAVDVVFAQRYPQWPRLFADLLPAHLLKDSPRSWSTALADSIPVSGGPFSVSAVDRDRGQVVLARNDHYWATPAVLDGLVLRRTDPAGMVEGLRRGDLPVAQVWPDQNVLAALRALAVPTPAASAGATPPGSRAPRSTRAASPPPTAPPAARLQPVAQPVVVQLGLRTDAGPLADDKVRHAVGALLDRDTLIAIGTGNGAGGVRVDAQLLAPTTPGYRPTMPPGAPGRPDPKLAEALLASAGYTRDQQRRVVLGNVPLRVNVGAPTGNTRFLAIAREVTRQLTAAGLDAQLVDAPGSVLYSEPTVPAPAPVPSPSPSATPPAAPTPEPVAAQEHAPGPPSAPPAGAPGTPQAGGQPDLGAGAGVGPGAGSGSSTQPTPAAAPPAAGVRVDLEVQPRAVGSDLATEAVSGYGCPPGMAGVDQPARNPTGFCSADLQPALDGVLSSGLTADQAAAGVEPVLWRELPAIPLFQVVTTLASTPAGDRATGNISPGPLLIGPLGTAATWHAITG
jgi:ABC-type transport system substrate-binding protein